MKKGNIRVKNVVFAAVMGVLLNGSVSAAELRKEFASPPDSARMWTWWFWLGDKVDRASITADLEAMKAQGIGGVTVYSISGPGVGGKGPDYMSPEWRALFKHAVAIATRGDAAAAAAVLLAAHACLYYGVQRHWSRRQSSPKPS
jgi:hypothetical protein